MVIVWLCLLFTEGQEQVEEPGLYLFHIYITFGKSYLYSLISDTFTSVFWPEMDVRVFVVRCGGQ